MHGDLGRLRKEDIVLVLSYGGETDEIIRLINLVKQIQIPLIAITGEKDSTLAKYSDVVLSMGKLNEACPLGVAPSVSTTCMLALGDALAADGDEGQKFQRGGLRAVSSRRLARRKTDDRRAVDDVQARRKTARSRPVRTQSGKILEKYQRRETTRRGNGR